MRMTCPACGRQTVVGRFCERCGAPLPGDSAPTVKCAPVRPPIEHAPQPASALPQVQPQERVVAPVVGPGGEPSLEIDSLCVLFEGLPGFIRFRFNPGATVENVSISLENPLSGAKGQSRSVAYLRSRLEIAVPVPAQEAGAFVWYVAVSYEASGRKRRLEGEMQMLVVRPREAQKAAEQLTVTINNTITNGNASDVHVSQRAVEELAQMAQSENPFEELRRIVLGTARAWSSVVLDSGGGMPTLPAQPPSSVRESVTLDLGTSKVSFFAERTVRLGRRRETNDIALRPPEGMPDDKYRAISRAHCHFGHRGDRIVIYDGQLDESCVIRPSAYGTYWNDAKIVGEKSLAAGDSGVLSFSGSASSGALAMDARACLPVRACATCPHANRTWCGDGRRPALMLTRRDGVRERFVMLWSCFPLEEADPSFEGVVIFRKDGAFAWRRGRRCGWLVPGETLNTDFGQVNIS